MEHRDEEGKNMIKIQFVDMFSDFNKENNYILKIIKKNGEKYELSDTPDFLFFSTQGTKHNEYTDCVKIFLADKEITPDFNCCDYAIGHDDMFFGDRYIKYPCRGSSCGENMGNELDGYGEEILGNYLENIFEKGNAPYEKDALGLAKKMSIPDYTFKELLKMLFEKKDNYSFNRRSVSFKSIVRRRRFFDK